MCETVCAKKMCVFDGFEWNYAYDDMTGEGKLLRDWYVWFGIWERRPGEGNGWDEGNQDPD